MPELTRLDALKIVFALIDRVGDDPAWEWLMGEAVGYEWDGTDTHFCPSQWDVLIALGVTRDELKEVQPTLNQRIIDEWPNTDVTAMEERNKRLTEALRLCLERIESDIETDKLKTAEGDAARAALEETKWGS